MVDLHSVTLREIRLALREPFVTSTGVIRDRRILLLEVQSGDGYTAWSECAAQDTPAYAPETVDTAWTSIRDWLIPALRSAGGSREDRLATVLDRRVSGHGMAKASLEMAAWNLEAQRNDVPLAELLGGVRRRVPAGIAVGLQENTTRLAERVLEAVEAGYRKVKLKIEPGSDREVVAAAREVAGDGVELAVDANEAYGRGDMGLLRSLDGFRLSMIEQPLAREDLVGHARLQEQLTTPICLDESITSRGSVETMIRLGSGRIVNVKPGRVGGLAASVAIHDLCGEHGVPAWVGGMLETGIGRAYNVALASLPYFVLPGDISPSSRYWVRDVVHPEWTMSTDGYVDVPFDRPGLGVEVDEDRIDALTVRSERLTV